jgi:hypothetical protein
MATPIQFEIDNFKPFIYGVNAYFSLGPAGQPVYSRFWDELAGGNIRLGARTSRSVPNAQNPGELTLAVLTSEAMNLQVPFRARIPGPFPNWVTGTRTGNQGDGREIWSFSMGASGKHMLQDRI